MQLADDQDLPLPQRKHSIVTFVTRPSSLISASSAGWTLQHLIITCAHEPIGYHISPAANLLAETQLEQLLRTVDAMLGTCTDLQTVEVLHSAQLVDEGDLATAKGMVRKCMPRVRDKVRLIPYDLGKEGGARVEIGDGEVVLEPFERLWRSDWIYEL